MLLRLLVISCWLLVVGCSRQAWHAPMVVRTDSSALLLPPAPAGKYKFTGPVNITVQAGNNNVATPTATAKVKADAAAIGPGAVATDTTTKKGGTPWWVFALVLVAGAGLAVWLQRRFSFLSFSRRRPLPSSR